MPLDPTGTDPASQRAVQEAVRLAVQQLQGIRFSVVAGTTAVTNIAVTGADTDAQIISVLQFDISAGNVVNVVDLTAEGTFPTAGNLQLATTNTTGDKLVVVWLNTPGTTG